jgi:hypothetical protein
MTIQLNPEEERLIGQAIQAGLIGKADDVVAVGVETIRRPLRANIDETVLLVVITAL